MLGSIVFSSAWLHRVFITCSDGALVLEAWHRMLVVRFPDKAVAHAGPWPIQGSGSAGVCSLWLHTFITCMPIQAAAGAGCTGDSDPHSSDLYPPTPPCYGA
jgi:hypothetical protein